MAVTVAQIANALSITHQDALDLLLQQGIAVANANSELSDSDLRKITSVIQQVKNQSLNEGKPSQADRTLSSLEYCFANYKVFIDTCSLLHFASDIFWSNAAPLIQKTGNKAIIPLRAIEEIKKHSANLSNSDLAKKASAVLGDINELIKAQLVEVRGEKSDNFADNVFHVVFTKFRMSHKLLLITQDGDLAADILNLNNIKSAKANIVYVKRLNKFGHLSNFSFSRSKDTTGKKRETVGVTHNKQRDEPLNEKEKFVLSRSLTSVPNNILAVSGIPSEGDEVFAQHGRQRVTIELHEVVASGGEGTIYTTNTQYVAKIYKKEKIVERKYEKIKLMLSKEISYKGICYPIACIYNKDEQFVGYLMPKAQGKELQKSLFIKPLLIKNFPDWKKRDTVELCVTILEKIKYLHDRNIIMGDINPANILVASPSDVYFVDTDSYQIEGFPCPVGTINYTAPEIQKKNFDSFLRTLGNENFAVATLLFMIMLPGKPPYSQQGGESPIDNIINMDFSYPFGEQSNKKTPDGPWRFIWSHLPYDIKEAFYHTFRNNSNNSNNSKNSAEDSRLSVDEWLTKFKKYLKLLDSDKLRDQDDMSLVLFPERHKKNPNVTYVKCKLCGMDASEEACKNGICPECLKKGDVYKCISCGKEIMFTNYLKYIKNVKRHDMCPECFEQMNAVYTTIRCSFCHRNFNITNGQYKYFCSKGLNLPKRCEQCRKYRQSYSSPASTSTVIPTNRTSSNASNSVRKSSWCFITTVVCDYLQKSDDCYELTALRQFRDGWLKGQPDGEALIAEYYHTAPRIANQLTNSSLNGVICNELWQEYIKPCIAYIETEDFASCKARYIAMVNYLKNIFIN